MKKAKIITIEKGSYQVSDVPKQCCSSGTKARN